MDFIKKLIDKEENQLQGQRSSSDGYGFTHSQVGSEYNGQAPPVSYGDGGSNSYSEGASGYGGEDRPPPPNVRYPWQARWDDRERRYLFVNEQSGERSWDLSGQQRAYGGDGSGGYGGRPQYESGAPAGYQQQGPYKGEEKEKEKSDHGLLYGGLAAAGGLAGGALIMHEYDEHQDEEEVEKRRLEGDIDQFGDGASRDVNQFGERAQDFPEDTARWTGEKVGEMEDIPQDVEQGFDRFGDRMEQGFDNAVDDVVEAPNNLARWGGEKVGDVERMGNEAEQYEDGIGDAYDQGRDEGRYDD